MEGGNVGDLAGNLGVESDGGDEGDAGEIGDIGLPWGWGALAGFSVRTDEMLVRLGTSGCRGDGGLSLAAWAVGGWARSGSRQARGEAKLCPAGTHATPHLPRPSVAWSMDGPGSLSSIRALKSYHF